MTAKNTDLAQAFQWARGRYMGRGNAPVPALTALQDAKRAIAALPALQEAAAAAYTAKEAARAIDGRRYAPAFVAAQEASTKAGAALDRGRAWQWAGAVWRKGYCGTWQSEKGQFFVESPDSLFRNVTPAHEILTGRDVARGWYTDPYQDGLCVAYVVQLRGRNRVAYYAPAYGFSEQDGIIVDLSRLVASDPEAERESARRQIGKTYWTPDMERAVYWHEGASESARKEAARIAQDMAEKEAEKEREYQTAWQAGSQWAALKEGEESARKEALSILAERRAARDLDPSGFPALCGAIRGAVSGLVSEIVESRAKRAKLQEGDSPDLYFWPGEERLKAAFCEGAELAAFPA